MRVKSTLETLSISNRPMGQATSNAQCSTGMMNNLLSQFWREAMNYKVHRSVSTNYSTGVNVYKTARYRCPAQPVNIRETEMV